MADTEQLFFQDLLAKLAAEHDRVLEHNRYLRDLAPQVHVTSSMEVREVWEFAGARSRRDVNEVPRFQDHRHEGLEDMNIRGSISHALKELPDQPPTPPPEREGFDAKGQTFENSEPDRQQRGVGKVERRRKSAIVRSGTRELVGCDEEEGDVPDLFFNPFAQGLGVARGSTVESLPSQVSSVSHQGREQPMNRLRSLQRLGSFRRITNVSGNSSFDARKRAAEAFSTGFSLARTGTCAINPEHSRFLGRWDHLTMVSLIFVAIVSPYQIALIKTTEVNTLFWINSFIDCIFFIDMLMQFAVMYPRQTSYGTALEHRPHLIAKNYLRSWFAIDFLSVVPFDLISMMSEAEAMDQFKAVKVIRLLRLMKLMRIMRASRLFRRFEHRMPISYKHWALLRFFVMLMVITHWMACLWALTLILVEEDENVPRWVDSFKEMEENVSNPTEATPWKLWVASVYFTTYTLTSVGYGDVGPKNILERIVCVFMLVVSGTSWAVVLGQVCGIVANMNPDEQAFRMAMDELNLMMRERAFPQTLRSRLRSFLHANKQAQRHARHQENLLAMSDGLRGEVAIQINRLWISKVSLLNSLLQQMETSARGRFIWNFIVEICLELQVEVHAQLEIFGEPQVLYILARGLVSRPPRLYLQGSVWGTDFLLSDKHLLEPCESFALTYVELTVLTRAKFFLSIVKFKALCPGMLRSVRRFCCWLAFQRAIMREAKRRQALQLEELEERQEAQQSDNQRGVMFNLGDDLSDDVDGSTGDPGASYPVSADPVTTRAESRSLVMDLDAGKNSASGAARRMVEETLVDDGSAISV